MELIESRQETSNMLIMTLAYTEISENKNLIGSHYDMLKNWGQYLVTNSLAPSNQYVISTIDVSLLLTSTGFGPIRSAKPLCLQITRPT